MLKLTSSVELILLTDRDIPECLVYESTKFNDVNKLPLKIKRHVTNVKEMFTRKNKQFVNSNDAINVMI